MGRTNSTTWSPWRSTVALVALAVCVHVLILASPGFYAHDEWQRSDAIRQLGFWKFVTSYAAIRVGPDFGFPVRPIGFVQQGLAAMWMESLPALAHLFGVLNHAIAAVLLAWVVRRAGFTRFVAELTAVLFIISPLTTLATGWLGASFDQLYVIFVLVAVGYLVDLPARALNVRGAAVVIAATTAALLCKETAIATPGVVALLGFVAWARMRPAFPWRRYLCAAGLVAIPVVCYLAYRAPALAHSFAGHGSGVYTPTAARPIENALYYFAFPFVLRLDDMTGSVAVWQVAAAAILHAGIVIMLRRAFGIAASTTYVCGYFLFLLPVLPLPFRSAHYLYASGLAMSFGLALLAERWRGRPQRWPKVFLVACAALAVVHGVKIQWFLYETGRCQNRLLTSLDRLRDSPSASGRRVVIAGDPGAPLSVAMRALFQRSKYQSDGDSLIDFDESTSRRAPSDRDAMTVRMSRTCELRTD